MEEIYQNVIKAMQDAEEIGGPEGVMYISLMQRISAEAQQRAMVALAVQWESVKEELKQ